VYAACLFCNKDLGRNDIIEHFPVGRRLAYEEAKGRLWVICRHCERWNLTPLETRWEAIEEAERSFRATRLRIATENIGLARLSEGLELVRIGAPPRLELAGWRYGDQFGRRRRKYFAYGGLGVAASALPVLGALGLGWGAVIVAGGASVIHTAFDMRKTWRDRKVPMVFLRDEADGLLPLTVHDTWSAKLVPVPKSREWYLTVQHRERGADYEQRFGASLRGRPQAARPAVFRGAAAQRALASLLPQANLMGGSARRVREAVRVIESSSSLDQLVYDASAMVVGDSNSITMGHHLTRLPTPMRLALEMVLHDDDERRAMEGQLAELEQRWRDAEQIASIADSLLTPADTEARLEALRDRSKDAC
jgi:hypothetical protein